MHAIPTPLGPVDTPLDDDAYAAAPRPALADPPRLTVVTPSYNQGSYLEATLRSVLGQGYPNLDYLVIDGGSTDGSVGIIRHYAPLLSHWVSEADGGQPDAIAKGLARATGEWFIWINSDDLLAPGALWRVAQAAAKDVDVIAGACVHFDADGIRKTYVPRNISAVSVIGEQLGSGVRWQQPSTWLRREALLDVGVDPTLQYAFDHDLLIRYLARFPRVRYLAGDLSYFRFHGASKTVSQGPKFRSEQVAMFARLRRDPALRALHQALDLAERGVDWLRQVDGLVADRARSRWTRLRELAAGARSDPKARCTRNTWRAGRRILMYGGRR